MIKIRAVIAAYLAVMFALAGFTAVCAELHRLLVDGQCDHFAASCQSGEDHDEAERGSDRGHGGFVSQFENGSLPSGAVELIILVEATPLTALDLILPTAGRGSSCFLFKPGRAPPAA